MSEHLTVVKNDEQQKQPVVFFFQGSGGNNGQAASWTAWFKQHNISAVWIDSAGARGLRNLYGKHYASDLGP